jgi:hypothetical protein
LTFAEGESLATQIHCGLSDSSSSHTTNARSLANSRRLAAVRLQA